MNRRRARNDGRTDGVPSRPARWRRQEATPRAGAPPSPAAPGRDVPSRRRVLALETPSPDREARAAPAALAGRRKRSRFWRLVLAYLGEVKWPLLLAVLSTVAGTALGLLNPWPLKIILDHGLLAKPLPPFLRFIDGITAGDKVGLVGIAAGGIVLIALCAAFFSYVVKFITTAVGYKLVYALRRELFAHVQRLSLSFHTQARSGDS